ncbi:cytochrome c biogenesis CcdA family protein [Georgenia sp. SUBG003]|uniref:cytochrome c biogenesis CcdA family protein n=1 Tax=Georgenia sp. SUBG003 TaxID=1497974 RepID=UPI003AB697B2
MARLLPGVRTVQATAPRRSGLLRSFLLGGVSGVAGFCSGPILGAVLTMAATEESLMVAGTMLAVYGAGMVVPLLGLAALWNRLGATARARLRGREVQVGRLRLHTTSVVTAMVLVAVGVVFVTTNGMAALPELLPPVVLGSLQTTVLSVSAAVPEPLLIVLAALGVMGVWAWRRRSAASADAPAGVPATGQDVTEEVAP